MNNQQDKLDAKQKPYMDMDRQEPLMLELNVLKSEGDTAQIHKDPQAPDWAWDRASISLIISPDELKNFVCSVFLQSLSCVINHSKISSRSQQSSVFVLRIINVQLDFCSCCGGNCCLATVVVLHEPWQLGCPPSCCWDDCLAGVYQGVRQQIQWERGRKQQKKIALDIAIHNKECSQNNYKLALKYIELREIAFPFLFSFSNNYSSL